MISVGLIILLNQWRNKNNTPMWTANLYLNFKHYQYRVRVLFRKKKKTLNKTFSSTGCNIFPYGRKKV